MLRWVVSLVSVIVILLAVAPLAGGHGGQAAHPTACRHYQGRIVLLRQCIRKCYHPHDRSRRSIRRCVRKFKQKHP